MKFQGIKNSIINKLPISDDERRVLDRRLNKLTSDPKGFLRGSYNKRSAQIIEKTPIKYKGSNDFTVVSAVYNVEKYLDEYFKSLINQSLSFKRHIQLILVDDGSTDSSAEIIKKWQKKYPKNITYLYKSNGGQASARNMGIEFVNTEWVTFIDPDDFVSFNYFLELDSFIEKNPNMVLIGCPLILYFEDENEYKDKHPLNYRFKKGRKVYAIKSLESNIQLSASTAIFKTRSIKDLKFDEEVKPNFEDAKFVGDYLLANIAGEIGFIDNISYFYRKRADGTSTLDSAWSNPALFSDVLSKGCLSLLESAYSQLGYVPIHIQRVVLYHLAWYFKFIVNKEYALSFLSTYQKDNFLSLLHEVFKYIDYETIMNFELAGTWFLQKVAWIGLFKNEKVEKQIVYIKNVDREKNQVLISCFTYFDIAISFRIDNKDVIPKYEKIVHYKFLDSLFVQEQFFWIPVDLSKKGILTVESDGKASRITLNGKHHHSGVKITDVFKSYEASSKYADDGSWLLMDRDTQADDNAEHLYRYIFKNYPEQELYFALRKSSHDWKRLELEGFNLIDFSSNDFEHRLCRSSKIISSHLDNYISNYFGDNYEYSKKFVFLQHGVIKDNLSKWFNTKSNLTSIITTTIPEYQSLVENGGYYNLTEKEVVLTGLPRHDLLLRNNDESSKVILIMPTWRQNIIGKIVSNGNTRAVNQGFMETEYAKHWYDVLHSRRLEQLAEKYNYKIIFAPHANIEPYMTMFNVPKYIDIWQASTAITSMQQLFQQSKLMITDYSSVAFEMGLLNKTVLYYQFDQDEVFSGGHITQRGYFSYENDGFGPVVTEEDALLTELENILTNDGNPLEPYLTRMQETFAYRDTNNCKRVYEAILDLDRPDTSEVSVATIMEYAQQAITHEAWDLALERIENALQHSDITQAQLEVINRNKEQVIQTGYQHDPVKLANILWHEKRLGEGLEKLKQVQSTEVTDELLRLRVKLAILSNDFILARDSQKMLLEEYSDNCTIEDWQFYTQLANI